MTRTQGTGEETYRFCRNSPYYEMVVKNINRVEDILEKDVQKEDEQQKKDVENVKSACNSFSYDVCSFEKLSSEDICKKILYMYIFLDNAQRLWKKPSTITNEDLDFLNYWLNVKLKDKSSNASMCIGKFIEKIKSQGTDFISREINLEKHLHVIDPSKLENMEILCELYDTKKKITDIMFDLDITDDEKKLCPGHLEKCHDKYIEGMYNCRNGYDDFCKAIKNFERDYNYIIEKEKDESGQCKTSEYFQLLDYDSFVEKPRRIMTIKFLSSPLILSFVIPLLYKYTPLGPLLRTKINAVKNRWMNPDKNREELLLSSTDIEDNISDNGDYNIGYYSGTN
ncbi:PIR Superfamily Protein [Plasmodium ovale curtisi]|uniref:PIR Superfamily Protein n=1 Tax=Plasmodium ovale curtisi TaxID=864141 RepID=A0A1A8WQH9_PLAOA|nr:PIR Superfamily Protein [Plasmodium ovale curtisi]